MSEEGKRAAAEIAARLKELTEQRDQLLAAIINLAETAGECDSWESFPDAPLDQAWVAITRAERNP